MKFSFFLLLLLVSVEEAFPQVNPGHEGKILNSFGNTPYLKQPLSVCVSGNFAYIGSVNSTGAFEIVDVTNPNVPVHKSGLKDGDGGAILTTPRSVTVSGNYAYSVAEAGLALEIIDVSDPANPKHKGSIRDGGGTAPYLKHPIGLAVSGNYAYVTDYLTNALEIIDVSNPALPVHKGSLLDGGGVAPYLNQPYAVQVVGNYAYVASVGSNALEIVDVSNPAQPVHAGSLTNGTGGAKLSRPHSVFVLGNYALVASQNSNALEIVDITNPASPTHKGSLVNGAGGALLQAPFSVVASGNYAYVASNQSNALEIVDITNPSSPTHKGSLTNGTGGSKIDSPWYLTLSGSKVFMASYLGNALEIVDVANPSAPVHSGVLSTGPDTPPFLDQATSLQVSGNYVYVASTNSNALEIIDKTNTALPTHKGSIVDGGGNAPYLNSPYSVRVVGNNAYVGSFNSFEIVDVSNPGSPIHKGSLLNNGGNVAPYLGAPIGMSISGNYAYVVDQSNGAFEIIDVSNSAAPVHKGSIQSGGGSAPFLDQPTSVFVQGNYAYITESNGHLEIINVSNPASPVHAGSLADGGGSAPYLSGAASVYVSGSYAYVVSSFSNAVEIIDVSNPLLPTHKGSLLDGGGSAPFLNTPVSISVQGNYAYVASEASNALEVIDVTNPANPTHYKSLLDGSGGAFVNNPLAVYPSGNYVYMTIGSALEVVYLFYPSITNFAPSIGNTGTPINITGSNFNTNMIITFNGGATGAVSNVTATSATVVVPAAAKIGEIIVSVDGHIVSSTSDFVVSPTSINPSAFQPTSFAANWSDVNAVEYFLDVSADNFSTFVAGYNNRSVGNVTTFTVTGLSPATTYQYRVRSSNGSTTSPNSNPISSLTTPAIPVSAAATALTQTSFTANWSSITGTTGYYLDVSTDAAFTAIITNYNNLPVAGTSQSVTGLSAATTYYYRVRSANASSSSPSSDTVTALTVPATPVTIEPALLDQTSFTAKWNSVTGAAGYFIDVATDELFTSLLANYTDQSVTENSISISGLTTSTIYYYRVRSSNASGASGNSNVQSALTKPGTPTAGPADPSPTLTGFAAKWTQVQGATGYYLTVASDETFGTFILGGYNNKPVGDATSFPVSQLTSGTTYYYEVSASNASGSSPLSNAIAVTTLSPATSLAVTHDILFPTGGTLTDYRIISIPQLQGTELTTGLSEESFQKNWRVQHYNTEQDANVDITDITKLTAGVGYWANSNINPAPSIHVTGTNPKVSTSLTLQPGWNQIGNPFADFNVSWADVLAQNSTVSGIGNLFTYNVPAISAAQPFQQYDGLLTWGGGFVNSTNTSAVTLTLPIDLAHFNGRMASTPNVIDSRDLSSEEWFVPMTLQVGGNTNDLGGFGMHPQADKGIDRYDAIALPHFFTYVDLSTAHPEFFQPAFMRDVAPTSGNYAWQFSTSSNSEEHDASLSWNNASFGNGNAKLLLFDNSTGAMIDMRKTNMYSFHMDASHSIRIFFSVDGDLRPDVTSVGQPYPNPFSTRLTIPFITSDANEMVEFTLYDMMGKPVRTLIKDTFSPGYHEAAWDGGDDLGRSVSPGIYVYLFSSPGSLRKSGKVILR